MRLIDADALKETIKDINEIMIFPRDNLLGIERLIEVVPTVDRPQGEWKHLEGDEWVCSNCGYVVWTEGSWEHPLEREKLLRTLRSKNVRSK